MQIYLNTNKAGQYQLATESPGSPDKSPKAAALLKTLAKTSEVTVVFSPELGENEARAIFRKLLSAQIHKHRRWMLTDGVLLPFSIPLTLIPGPNLVLFYLAWRTWSHYQSQKGGRHALNRLPLRFVAAG